MFYVTVNLCLSLVSGVPHLFFRTTTLATNQLRLMVNFLEFAARPGLGSKELPCCTATKDCEEQTCHARLVGEKSAVLSVSAADAEH